MGELTAKKISKAKPGRHTDGDGLMLLVKQSGARSWVLRVQVDGKRRDIGIGSVNTDSLIDADDSIAVNIPLMEKSALTLAEARMKAAQFRQLAKSGRDPVAELKRDRSPIPSFADAALKAHNAKQPEWSPKTANAFMSSLEQHAFPKLGRVSINEIDACMIADTLRPIWMSKPMIARKVRQRIGLVLNYAGAMRWRDNPVSKESISLLLPAQLEGGHLPSMPYKQVPAFVASLNEGESVGRLALLFLIFTGARTGEVRGAEWNQIDKAEKLWFRPASLMKGRNAKAHTVTLNQPALDLLEIAASYRRNDNDLIFPSRGGKILSDMALSSFMSGMEWTPHGFRSSLRDWAAEKRPDIPDPVAEAAIAHKISDKVVRAYKRTTFLEMRRNLLDDWGQFCVG